MSKITDKIKNKKSKDESAKVKSAKFNYKKGLWNSNMLRVAVKKGVISISEFEDITKEKY